MSCRYMHPIRVWRHCDASPSSFLWREQRYRIVAVYGKWHLMDRWWERGNPWAPKPFSDRRYWALNVSRSFSATSTTTRRRTSGCWTTYWTDTRALRDMMHPQGTQGCQSSLLGGAHARGTWHSPCTHTQDRQERDAGPGTDPSIPASQHRNTAQISSLYGLLRCADREPRESVQSMSKGLSMTMPAAASPPRLLVVEDDRDQRAFFQDVLQDMGYHCLAASSLDQALRIIHQQPIDLIISDLFSSTPRNAVASLRPLLALAQPVPVIASTAWPVTDTQVHEQ
jgi:CheY-like chemotaxis protein